MLSRKLVSTVRVQTTVIALVAILSSSILTGSADRGSGKSADPLVSALLTLEEAVENEKANPGKAAALAVEAALDRYNVLAAARIAEIERSLKRLDRQIARLETQTEPPRESESLADNGKAPQRWLPQSLELRYLSLRNELRRLARPTASLAPRASLEMEPNDSPGQANPLDVSLQPVVIGSGFITPAGDQDFYSIQVPADSFVWAYIDTGGTQLGTSNDSFLAILGPDGTTLLESDDDDGTGNGCDATTESLAASAVAGLIVSAPGTYFARVTASSPSDTINPYKLFVCVVPASSIAAEIESNDTPSTANVIIPAGAAAGMRSGALSSPADVDLYVVPVAAGTPLYVSADTDPVRDGGSDIAVDLLTPDGQTVLFTADSSGSEVSGAEAFCFLAPTTDRYLVRVRQSSSMRTTRGGSGAYRLLVAEAELAGRCPPAIIRAQLGSGSVDYPGMSGFQTGRLTRNGVVSFCETPKSCPGVFDTMGLRAFDAYTFTNSGATPACLSVTYTTQGCPFPGVFAAAYVGVYDPNNLCMNHIADSGFSIVGDFTWNFSLTLGPGQSAVVVFSEVNPGSAAGCAYTVVASGLACTNQIPYDVCMRDDATGATLQAFVGDRTSAYYGRWQYQSATETLCGRAETVNYVPDRSLTMRDHLQADNTGCEPATMQAQFDFARRVAIAQVARLGEQSITLRDRDLADSMCGP